MKKGIFEKRRFGVGCNRSTQLSIILAASLLVSPALALSGQHDHDHDHNELAVEGDSLGAVDFGVACETDVQSTFDRGLKYLHHMMYELARDTFEEVLEEDSSCAMAHWGVATTLFQPLWGTRPDEDILARGSKAIERAADLGGGDERETLLIEATAAFFDPDEDAGYGDRIGGWIEGMEAAYESVPEDHDVAALYALTRLTLGQQASDPHPLHDEADEVLVGIIEENPEHPGAVHYLIHSDDVEGRQHNHLEIVETYSDIAPRTAHALHMPSHIYVRTGDWREVIDWNRKSGQAALEHPVNGTVSLHYIHAQDYKVYGYLQKGDDERADEVAAESFEQGELEPSTATAFHVATIPARIAVERRDWQAAAELAPRKIEDVPWDAPMGLWAEAQSMLAIGMGALHTGDLEAGGEALDRIKALRKTALEEGEDSFAHYIEIEESILCGWLAWADDRPGDAVDFLEKAVALEKDIEKHPITPGALMPPRESLGDLLMELGHAEQALEAYRASDEVWPRRFNTVLGAARAADAAGKDEAAREYYAELLELAGDSEREHVAEARSYIED